jgi:hypothetical protein
MHRRPGRQQTVPPHPLRNGQARMLRPTASPPRPPRTADTADNWQTFNDRAVPYASDTSVFVVCISSGSRSHSSIISALNCIPIKCLCVVVLSCNGASCTAPLISQKSVHFFTPFGVILVVLEQLSAHSSSISVQIGPAKSIST